MIKTVDLIGKRCITRCTLIKQWSTILTRSQSDPYHGHVAVTADYPNGIYHYHITADAPYINGNGFYGTPGTVTQ